MRVTDALAGSHPGVPIPIGVPVDGGRLIGDLVCVPDAAGLVLFAHGSGSSRLSPRNTAVARQLEAHGFATLLIDLLTPDEEIEDRRTSSLRFDIPLLAHRVEMVVDWIGAQPSLADLPLGLFGASTGAGAALQAAAARPGRVGAIVSRGGRPDLAGDALRDVDAPTLLLVGGNDLPVIDLNRHAVARMQSEVTLEIVPEAGHLFDQPGALEHVATRAAEWFALHLRTPSRARH
jgi:dienelactone hydrolase